MVNNLLQTVRRYRVLENRKEDSRIFRLVLEPDPGTGETIAPLEYTAGQWVFLHLLNEDGTTWKAAFSIASAPDPMNTKIELAIKIFKDFTAKASQLSVGETVGIQGPFGMFGPSATDQPLVFIAAGIGITPLRSMILDLYAHRPSRSSVTLLYSCREPSEMVFKEEFERLANDWPAFKPIFVLTGDDASWKGERGRISEESLRKYIAKPEEAEYLVCGPQAFVLSIRSALETLGADVKTWFKAEMFG